MQFITVLFSNLWFATVYYIMFQYNITMYCSIIQCITGYNIVIQFITVFFSNQQFVAVYCSMFQHKTMYYSIFQRIKNMYYGVLQFIQYVTLYYSVLK